MHPSRVTDRSQSYERIEFLGDSILGLLVARELFERYPDAAEGRLSRLRSAEILQTRFALRPPRRRWRARRPGSADRCPARTRATYPAAKN